MTPDRIPGALDEQFMGLESGLRDNGVGSEVVFSSLFEVRLSVRLAAGVDVSS